MLQAPGADSVNELQVIYREQDPGSPKRFEVRDLKLLLALLLLWPVSWFLPPAWWPRVASSITRYKELVPWEAYPEEIPALRSVYGNEHPAQKLTQIELSVDVHRHMLRMQILRQLTPRGWRPLIDCEGIENLERALARGKDVILWMSHFIYNGLVGKIGLHQHGFQVHHVSRPEHGFSKTRFGILTVNQLRIGAEAPFLAGRIVIDRGGSPDRISAIRQATAAFLQETGQHVRTYPDQWRSWRKLNLP